MGKTIYIAGQVPFDSQGKLVGRGNLEAQTVQVFENIRKVLDAFGTSFDDVVLLDIVATVPLEKYQMIREIRRRYFTKRLPVCNGCIVKSLAAEGILVEIGAIAIVKE